MYLTGVSTGNTRGGCYRSSLLVTSIVVTHASCVGWVIHFFSFQHSHRVCTEQAVEVTPLRCRLFTLELRWQSRGKLAYLAGVPSRHPSLSDPHSVYPTYLKVSYQPDQQGDLTPSIPAAYP